MISQMQLIYILVRGDITIIRCDVATEVTFKKCAPFINCIPRVEGTTIDDAEDSHLIMSMYKLLE